MSEKRHTEIRTLADLRRAVEADREGYWNALGVLRMAEEIDSRFGVHIEGCIFRGRNADGTPLIEYRRVESLGSLPTYEFCKLNLQGAEIIGALQDGDDEVDLPDWSSEQEGGVMVDFIEPADLAEAEYDDLLPHPAPDVAAQQCGVTPAEIGGLVERLNLPWPPDGSGDEVTLPVWAIELMAEAATALKAKEAELAWRRNQVEAEETRANAAEAALAEVRKAMEASASALDEAMEDVSHWGSYAGEYFQNKHDLEGDLDRIAKQASAARRALTGGQEE